MKLIKYSHQRGATEKLEIFCIEKLFTPTCLFETAVPADPSPLTSQPTSPPFSNVKNGVGRYMQDDRLPALHLRAERPPNWWFDAAVKC